jgi:hypothetical protein
MFAHGGQSRLDSKTTQCPFVDPVADDGSKVRISSGAPLIGAHAPFWPPTAARGTLLPSPRHNARASSCSVASGRRPRIPALPEVGLFLREKRATSRGWAGQEKNDDELQETAGRSISNACCSIFNVHSVDILRVCAVLGMRNISRSGSIHPGLGDTRQQAKWCTSPSCYEQCTCRNARSSRSSRRELGRSASVTGLDRAGIAFCLDNG